MSLKSGVNPYAPLSFEEPEESWRSRLLGAFVSWFRQKRGRTAPQFQKGGAMVFGGIAFFIDPGDETTLYAGSPSLDRSDRRVALIAHEALKLLPDFLEENTALAVQILQRRLVVRIVHSYDGIWSDYYRAVEILPAPLRDHLSAVRESP